MKSCYNCGDDKDNLTSRLNKRVTILRNEITGRGEYGAPIESWTPVATVWAAIEPLQGQEYFAAYRENANVTTRIRIRYRTGIDRTMIVRYGDAEFEIEYIIHPKFAKVELQLMSRERQ